MTTYFLLNLLIALIWVYFTPPFTPENLALGFGVGYALLALYGIVSKKTNYHIRLLHCIWLFIYFHYELLTSSLKVLKDIMTPGQGSKPGFVAMPLTAKTPLEIFFTANLISLTPGTLSIALSSNYQILYIHAMFVDTPEETVRSLKHFESVILRAFR